LKILAIGDVIGKPGRQAVKRLLPVLRQDLKPALVIANGENAAGGIGLTMSAAQELLDSGTDVITTGNHVWDQREIIPYLDSDEPIIRPINYPPGVPGRGFIIKNKIMVVNAIGRTFIGAFDCPFRGMDHLLAEMRINPPVIIVDFHAEASSEKVALGRYLDGRVSAVLGTHTHVGTVDARVLPGGTAHITDIGMCGPFESIIGDDCEAVLHRFLTLMPHRLSVGKGNVIFNSVLVDVNENTGKAISIERIDREVSSDGQD